MQKVATISLQPGMITAQNIFTKEGVLLLSIGTTLSSGHIVQLHYLGLPSIYIKNPLTANSTSDAISEIVPQHTRAQAIQAVHTAFEDVLVTRRIDSAQFKKIAACLIDEIIKNNCAMIHLTDIRSRDGYLFGHSVNVCVLAALTGFHLGYSMAQLKELALGALLHDTGKMLIPKEILTKPGPLTADEVTIMNRHPGYGFEILSVQREIPPSAAQVAYQHHERFDGNGYPRNLRGTDIHEYARIVAIADVYDAITSDRCYREGLLPHEAYEITVSQSRAHFDPAILKTFLSQIAIYPVGCIVRVNTGEIAVVTKVIPGLQTRPILQTIFDAGGHRVKDGREIDLTKQLTTFINKIYTLTEILQLGATYKQG